VTKPQSAEVLHLLRASGIVGVTQQDAIRFAQCYRLAARIADLRAEGYRILSVQVSKDGHRFARYILEEAPEQLVVGL
jgi:hypothetical protein